MKLMPLMAAALLLTSCLEDNDSNSTVYGDTAIVAFTMGTLNRYTETTSAKTGNDTVVKTTVTGTLYPMTIDHFAGRIYNLKALPVGTDVKHVVCTISTKNSGLLALKSMTSDSLAWHASADSVDFSMPRLFRVFSTDGTAYRDYTVEVSVSQEAGASYCWTLAASIGSEGIGSRRLVASGDTVSIGQRDSIVGRTATEAYMFADDGTLRCSRDNGRSWQQETLDDDTALLPTPATATTVSWSYATADDTDYVLMVGTPRQDSETTMRVWRKICHHQAGGTWVYMPFSDFNKYPLPRQEHIALARYNGALLALGTDGVMRMSQDQGISWHESTTYALSGSAEGTVVSMAADGAGRLWVLTDAGQLWRYAMAE